MKKLIPAILFTLLLFANGCQKCYDCKQYCAYCLPNNGSGVVVKLCADKDAVKSRVDSLYFAYNNAGYNCSLLNNEKKVCDSGNKISEAVDYYKLQNYFCNPWAE